MGAVMRIIAIVNQKGGVGKTSTVISLGAALVRKGRRVLLVDLDSNQSLSASLKIPPPRPGLADVLLSIVLLETARLADVVVDVQGMSVASGDHLAFAESKLNGYRRGAENALKLALAPHAQEFDYVLLDCSPSRSFLNVAALVAATEVLIPIQTEFLALSQLSATVTTVEKMRSALNPDLKIIGLVPTLYDPRTLHSREVLEHIAHQAHGYNVLAYKPIPRNIRMAEAPVSGTTIFQYAPRCPAALAYSALAAEIDR